MIRRNLFAAALGLAAFAALAAPASAAEPVPYTQAAFQRAQQAGQPILIDIYAPWCPICRAQEPIVSRVSAEPVNARLVIFRVDFDHQKDAVRSFGARQQSTLIAFRGTRETGRSVGDTDAARLTALINSTH